ncbi:MAG: hypothetical protein ACTSVF_03745, partial [Candidatus Asgardarchaeia archaeon]
TREISCGNFITVEKEVEERNTKSILVIDLGIRWMATTVNSNNTKLKFYGKRLRRVKDTTSISEDL